MAVPVQKLVKKVGESHTIHINGTEEWEQWWELSCGCRSNFYPEFEDAYEGMEYECEYCNSKEK
jgi:hypothetical protein